MHLTVTNTEGFSASDATSSLLMHSGGLQDSGAPDENPHLVSNEVYMPGQFTYPLSASVSLSLEGDNDHGRVSWVLGAVREAPRETRFMQDQHPAPVSLQSHSHLSHNLAKKYPPP